MPPVQTHLDPRSARLAAATPSPRPNCEICANEPGKLLKRNNNHRFSEPEKDLRKPAGTREIPGKTRAKPAPNPAPSAPLVANSPQNTAGRASSPENAAGRSHAPFSSPHRPQRSIDTARPPRAILESEHSDTFQSHQNRTSRSHSPCRTGAKSHSILIDKPPAAPAPGIEPEKS